MRSGGVDVEKGWDARGLRGDDLRCGRFGQGGRLM